MPQQFHFINRDNVVHDPNADIRGGNLHRRERYNEATVRWLWGILPLRSRNRSASENVIRVSVTRIAVLHTLCCPAASAENWLFFATSLRHVTFTSLSSVCRLDHFFRYATRDGLGKLRPIMDKSYDGRLSKLRGTFASTCTHKCSILTDYESLVGALRILLGARY